MSCGIPHLFSLLWSIRDKAKGEESESPAPPPSVVTNSTVGHTGTRTRTRTRTTTVESELQADNQNNGLPLSESKLHSRGSALEYSTPGLLLAPSDQLSTASQLDFNQSPASQRIQDGQIPERAGSRTAKSDRYQSEKVRTMATVAKVDMGRGAKRCYATLLTRASYLPGVVVLAHTLRKYGSKYPLVVLVTPSLPRECVEVVEGLGRTMRFENRDGDELKDGSERGNERVVVWKVEPLLPGNGQVPDSLIAARFEDTWTKLRVFELTSYDAVCFLDADIALFNPIDEIFTVTSQILPDETYLAATHACVCNLDHDVWADPSWTALNCAFTPQTHPSALTEGPPVPPYSTNNPNDPKHETHTLLNGGVFVFHPSPAQWKSMLTFFETSTQLKEMKFPDQDFLALFFRDKWRTVPWRFNALKTMRQWHENIWVRDADVVALHYIVDKPWSSRVASDGIAGYLGRDGDTHVWWWALWDEWVASLGDEGKEKEGMSRVLRGLIAEPLSEKADRRQVQENKEKGFPVPVPQH